MEAIIFTPLLQMVMYRDKTDSAYQIWANYIDSIPLRVAGQPENFQAVVRSTLAGIDSNLTVLKLTKLEDQVSSSFNSPRLIARLTTLYGPTFSPPRRVPHGVTLIGRLFNEGTLGRAGFALEHGLGVGDERPPGF